MPTAAEAVPDQSEAAFQAPAGTNAYAANDVITPHHAAAAPERADRAAPAVPAQAPALSVRASNPASRASNPAPRPIELASRPFADAQLLVKLQQQVHMLRQTPPSRANAAALTPPLLTEQQQQACRPTPCVRHVVQELPWGCGNSCIRTFHLLAPVNRHAMTGMRVSVGTDN